MSEQLSDSEFERHVAVWRAESDRRLRELQRKLDRNVRIAERSAIGIGVCAVAGGRLLGGPLGGVLVTMSFLARQLVAARSRRRGSMAETARPSEPTPRSSEVS